MAKIVSDNIIIKVSRIAKDNEQPSSVVNAEITGTLEEVVQQLVGDGAVVEVELGTE